jgi:hypothetical protein
MSLSSCQEHVGNGEEKDNVNWHWQDESAPFASLTTFERSAIRVLLAESRSAFGNPQLS